MSGVSYHLIGVNRGLFNILMFDASNISVKVVSLRESEAVKLFKRSNNMNFVVNSENINAEAIKDYVNSDATGLKTVICKLKNLCINNKTYCGYLVSDYCGRLSVYACNVGRETKFTNAILVKADSEKSFLRLKKSNKALDEIYCNEESALYMNLHSKLKHETDM